MSKETKLVSHSAFLGKNLGQAYSEAVKKHAGKVKSYLDNAEQFIRNIEEQTRLGMPEFHENVRKAKEALSKIPPQWEVVKNEILDAFDKFAKKL